MVDLFEIEVINRCSQVFFFFFASPVVVCVLEVDRRTWLGLERDCDGGGRWGGIDRNGGKNKNIRAKGPASLQPECVTVQCVCGGVCVCARVCVERVCTRQRCIG